MSYGGYETISIKSGRSFKWPRAPEWVWFQTPPTLMLSSGQAFLPHKTTKPQSQRDQELDNQLKETQADWTEGPLAGGKSSCSKIYS